MKNYSILLPAMLFAAFALNSCSTVNGDRSDYFSYNNNPKVVVVQNVDNDDNEGNRWINPLSEDYDRNDDFILSYDYNRMPPVYTPVLVPWWDNTYSWYHRPFSGYYYGWGWNYYDMYDWYSPFYSHSPIYFSPWVYHHRHRWWDWYHYPVHYSDWDDHKKTKTYKVRDFGPNRGTYNSDGSTYGGTSSSTSGKSSGRSNQITGVKNTFDNSQPDKKIVYKPITTGGKNSFGDFPSSNVRSGGNDKRSFKLDNNSTNSNSTGKSSYSPTKSSSSGSYSGTSSGGSSGGSSGNGSGKSSGGSSSGSGSSGGSSSSPRSSGRTK
jgi:hypothetical protein